MDKPLVLMCNCADLMGCDHPYPMLLRANFAANYLLACRLITLIEQWRVKPDTAYGICANQAAGALASTDA